MTTRISRFYLLSAGICLTACFDLQDHPIEPPIFPNYTVSGTISEWAEDGQPLEDVELTISAITAVYDTPLETYVTTTDSAGFYSFEDIYTGNYIVAVSWNGHMVIDRKFTVYYQDVPLDWHLPRPVVVWDSYRLGYPESFTFNFGEMILLTGRGGVIADGNLALGGVNIAKSTNVIGLSGGERIQLLDNYYLVSKIKWIYTINPLTFAVDRVDTVATPINDLLVLDDLIWVAHDTSLYHYSLGSSMANSITIIEPLYAEQNRLESITFYKGSFWISILRDNILLQVAEDGTVEQAYALFDDNHLPITIFEVDTYIDKALAIGGRYPGRLYFIWPDDFAASQQN